MNMKNKKLVFGIAALIFSIVGMALSWIYIINDLALLLGILLVTHNKKEITIAELVIVILAAAIASALQAFLF